MNHLNSKNVLKFYYVFIVLNHQTSWAQTFVKVIFVEADLAFFRELH
jgi:hypothetical protein